MVEFNNELVKSLLLQLAVYEGFIEPGDAILVQPSLDGMPSTNPVTAPGHNWDEVDRCLRWMHASGLISAGSVQTSPGIGIYFSRITEQGRRSISGNS